MHRTVAIAFALLPAAARAQSMAEGPSLVPMLVALAFVLALIPVSMWVLKRLGGGAPSHAAGLRVVAQLPLGPRERIVVVEAGERRLLLGVTGASITRIGTLPKPAPGTEGSDDFAMSPGSRSFASLLSAARHRG
jgi:flagellar protein FliO/FliZ